MVLCLQFPPQRILHRIFALPCATDPLSPHFAAKKWNKRIDLDEMNKTAQAELKDGTFLVMEGAGGLLVPYNEKELQIDFRFSL